MQNDEFVCTQGKNCVGTAVVIAELDFKRAGRQGFYDSAYLPSVEISLRDIFRQSDNV